MIVDYVRVYAPTNLPDRKTNLLSNAGFESANLANWTTYGNTGGNASMQPITKVDVHNGTNVFKVFGQANGSINTSGAYQDVPATPGQAFNASGWMFTSASDQIAAGNTAWIEVTFRNSASTILSLYRSTPVSASTPPGLWLNFAVTNQLNPGTLASIGLATNLIAPAGTAFVRCEADFLQPAEAKGSVYFDDLRLTVAGQAVTPVQASLIHSGSSLNLVFGTYLNLPYQINSKNMLADPNWSIFTNVSGTGSSQIVTLSSQTSSRFFQVSRVCN